MLNSLIIIAAIFGYTLGFGKLYLFHLLLVLWLFKTIFITQKLSIYKIELLYPVLAFILYAIISLIWTPDIMNGLRNLFYFLCGFFCIYICYTSSNSIEDLNKTFKIIFTVLIINLLIGLFESLGVFRLPMSVYSPYASLFGHTGIDTTLLSDKSLSILSNVPTGMDYNPNNFGFVMLLFFPFVVFHQNKWFKRLTIPIFLWVLISIGSKTLFVALMAFYVLLFFKEKYHILLKIGTVIVSIITILFYVFNTQPHSTLEADHGVGRMATTISQIQKGVDLIVNNKEITADDSTSTRAWLYVNGLKELANIYGLGLGIGGIEATLEVKTNKLYSFHNFFLEQLINFGIFISIFLSYWYLKMIYTLNVINKKTSNIDLQYLSKSSYYSSILLLISSIAPSSIIYILTFWIFIGFYLSIIKVNGITQYNQLLYKTSHTTL